MLHVPRCNPKKMTETTHRLAPHRDATDVVTSKRGCFWIPGDIETVDTGTVQIGQMFVRWEAPAAERYTHPLVLIHGGGGQGTEWDYTLSGKPGWSRMLVEDGFAVYVVDRVGHGRSRSHPALLGALGPPVTYETAERVFFPDERAEVQTQWPYQTRPGSPEVDRLVAGMGPALSDMAYGQRVDCERLCALLDLIGPSCLVTHSAGGPVGWLVADRRPDLVKAIVAVEPVGPPFAAIPGLGKLTWGLTAAPMTWSPPVHSAEELLDRAPSDRRIPALAELPIAVVSGAASPFAEYADALITFLRLSGAAVTWIELPKLGIGGNGHGIMIEANADETVGPVVAWLREQQRGGSSEAGKEPVA
jgi:pimeloyl-ACP methyl ester carboxylesterase